jgi:hypothetical protein
VQTCHLRKHGKDENEIHQASNNIKPPILPPELQYVTPCNLHMENNAARLLSIHKMPCKFAMIFNKHVMLVPIVQAQGIEQDTFRESCIEG